MESLDESFMTVPEVIELIQSHTEEEPIVNLKFLAVNYQYIEKGGNFTVKLLSKKKGKVVEDGTVYARIRTDAEKFTLIEEIKQAYKRNYDLDLNLDLRPTKEITTVVDPKTNAKGVPMLDTSKDPMYTPTRDTRIG